MPNMRQNRFGKSIAKFLYEPRRCCRKATIGKHMLAFLNEVISDNPQ
jgi:hypothetical protein